MANQIHDLDSKQVENFFVRGLVYGSLIHERLIETPPLDMNEVRSRAEGIFRIEENRQRIAKSMEITVAQNNTLNKSPKHYEAKGKLEEKQRNSDGRFDQRKRLVEHPRSDY